MGLIELFRRLSTPSLCFIGNPEIIVCTRIDQQRDAAQISAADALAQKRIATSRELAATALSNLGEDAQRSILLALQAVRTTQEQDQIVLPEAENALRRAVLAARAQLTLGPGEDQVVRVAFSPNGKSLASSNDHQGLILWDALTRQLIWQSPNSFSS